MDVEKEEEEKGCEEKKVESSAVKNVVVTTAGDRTLFPCPLNSYSTMYCRTSIKFFSLQSISIVIVLFMLTALVCSVTSQLWHDASPALDVQPPLDGDTFLQDDEDHYTTSLIRFLHLWTKDPVNHPASPPTLHLWTKTTVLPISPSHLHPVKKRQSWATKAIRICANYNYSCLPHLRSLHLQSLQHPSLHQQSL